jgi:hypothetical protein
MMSVDAGTWSGNWAWSLPLIVLTVLIHVFGLQFINDGVVHLLSGALARRRFIPMFSAVMGVTTLLATILHGIEATIWAGAYRHLGALPDNKAGMLYSLSAMTSYGHANLFLETQWQMMGALESLKGCFCLD